MNDRLDVGASHAGAMASAAVDAAQSMYRALRERDIEALTRILHPAVRATFASGLPFGLGGPRVGSHQLLVAWAAVARHYDIAPFPQQYLRHNAEAVVVIGRYRGRARQTGHPVDAAFAHVLEVRYGRVTALTQFTDLASWLAPAGL